MQLFLRLLLLLFLSSGLSAQSYSFPDWSLELNTRGEISALKDNHTGVNYIVTGQAAPLVSIKTKDTLLLPVKTTFGD
ncbi:MAG TPA: hypothetical protein PLL23_09035, partial [Chitinophagaceae bacterium]|nr:hypothetical protein [Chitinophagaceae bacterium]